jgi:hypothetical protein
VGDGRFMGFKPGVPPVISCGEAGEVGDSARG